MDQMRKRSCVLLLAILVVPVILPACTAVEPTIEPAQPPAVEGTTDDGAAIEEPTAEETTNQEPARDDTANKERATEAPIDMERPAQETPDVERFIEPASDVEQAIEPTSDVEQATEGEWPYENVDPSGTSVLWWHQHTRESAEGLQHMIAEFNAANEWGIQVTAEFAGGYSKIYDRMVTTIAAGDPSLLPNLVVGYVNQAAKYQLSGAMVDMDLLVDSPRWGLTPEQKADFYPGILEADVSPLFGDGHFRMGFPPNRSGEVLYYNLDWLNEIGYDGPPITWAEFEEMACAATNPAAGTVGYEISTDASHLASMVFSRHGTYFAEDGSTFSFSNDTVRDSMLFMKDLYDRGCVARVAKPYGDQADFGDHKTLFTIGSTAGLPYYDEAVKAGIRGEFRWGVAPLPYMDGGTDPVMNLYGASVSIPRTTPEQELAAWLFTRWMTEPENLARWVRISNYFPVRASAADLLADYLAANPTFRQAFDLLPYSTFEAQWCACYEEVRRLMADAYNAILDGADIDTTLVQLEASANVSLAENTP